PPGTRLLGGALRAHRPAPAAPSADPPPTPPRLRVAPCPSGRGRRAFAGTRPPPARPRPRHRLAAPGAFPGPRDGGVACRRRTRTPTRREWLASQPPAPRVAPRTRSRPRPGARTPAPP